MSDDALAVANLFERISRLTRTEEQIGDLYPAQWAALRYLGRANRFSRTPMALTRYLGTTRGTMSQTIIALDRKGYLERLPSKRDKRSVDLKLTFAGKKKLKNDPIQNLAKALEPTDGLDVKSIRNMLETALSRLIDANEGRSFGQCRTCRFFVRESAASDGAPFRCSLLDVSLSQSDSEDICVEHEAA